MKATRTALSIALALAIMAGASCASSDKEKATADSIARADSLAHAFDPGDSLLADFSKTAARIDTLKPDADWTAVAEEVGQVIVSRDEFDSRKAISDIAFQRINELLGNVNSKVETLPKATQDAYFNALEPLLDKAAEINSEQATEEIVE